MTSLATSQLEAVQLEMRLVENQSKQPCADEKFAGLEERKDTNRMSDQLDGSESISKTRSKKPANEGRKRQRQR